MERKNGCIIEKEHLTINGRIVDLDLAAIKDTRIVRITQIKLEDLKRFLEENLNSQFPNVWHESENTQRTPVKSSRRTSSL